MQRHTTGPRQMSRILEQAVGDIHRRGCPAPQSQPELALRTGLPETPGKIVAAPGIQLLRKRLSQYHCQSRRAITQRPADTQQVARPGATAAQRLPGRHLTVYSDADIQRAAGGVSADQADVMVAGAPCQT